MKAQSVYYKLCSACESVAHGTFYSVVTHVFVRKLLHLEENSNIAYSVGESKPIWTESDIT